jgi:hypothetical protein
MGHQSGHGKALAKATRFHSTKLLLSPPVRRSALRSPTYCPCAAFPSLHRCCSSPAPHHDHVQQCSRGSSPPANDSKREMELNTTLQPQSLRTITCVDCLSVRNNGESSDSRVTLEREREMVRPWRGLISSAG